MRWFLISLGFLIISWIFFVASFGFASPAQAETWSCAFIDFKKQAATMVFSRVDDKHFKSDNGSTFKILTENNVKIHLYIEGHIAHYLETAALFKDKVQK